MSVDEIADGGAELSILSSNYTIGGILTGPTAALRNMVAACPSFQNWVGAANATAALSSIHVQAVSMSGQTPTERPFCIVFIPNGSISTKLETGTYQSGSLLQLWFEANVAEADRDNHTDAFYAFASYVERIIEELWSQVGGQNSLLIQTMEMSTAPARADLMENEDYYQCLFDVRFGVS